MINTPLPPAGWYLDPSNSQQWRWWSGSEWTSHTSLRGDQAVAAIHYDSEMRIKRWATWAPIVYGLAALAALFFDFSQSHQWAQWFHAIRLALANSSNDNATFIANPPSLVWEEIWTLPVFAAQIVLLIWQFRSAVVARGLGYPSRYSPGWGVAAWLIPIVQLWIPYRAIRDLLPADHPLRKKLPIWWSSLIIGALFSVVLPFAMAYGGSFKIPLLCVVALTDMVTAVLGRSIVMAVTKAHSLTTT